MRTLVGLLLVLRMSTLCALLPAEGHKPLSQYAMQVLGHDDGIPGGGISALLQSRDGFLWIGTNNGLIRYDGVRFVSYDRAVFPALHSNRIKALFEDSRGDLWIGTEGGGVSVLHRKTIRTLTSSDGIPSEYIRSVAESPDGEIWIGTDGEGVCVMRPDTVMVFNLRNGGIDQRVTSVVAGRDSTIWVGTLNGLFRYAHNTWSVYRRKDGLPSDTISCMQEIGSDIWCGTYGGGVAVVEARDPSRIRIITDLRGATITGIHGTPGRDVFVTTLLRGVCRIRNGTVSSRAVGAHDRGEYATCIVEDRQGLVWAGFQDGRLIRLRDATFSFFVSGSGSQPDQVRSVMEGHDGKMYAATASTVRQLRGDSLVSLFPSDRVPLNSLSIMQDGMGTFWVGTLGNGLYRIRGTNVVKIDLRARAAVWALYADRSGSLWVGANIGLIAMRGDTPERYSYDKNRLSHSDVRAICERADGSLWVGTSYGLNRMEGDSFAVFTRRNCAISNDVVVSLYPDPNGDLWVGTLGGLNRLHDTTFTSFTVHDGLPDDAVGFILGDDEGHLWIGCDRGLYVIRKENLNRYAAGRDSILHPMLLDREDGLLNAGISGTIQPSAWKSHDGCVWFCTTSGLAMADPRRLMTDTVPPVLVIDDVVVDQRHLPIDSIPALAYDVNQIEISYTSPGFINAGNTRFRYRLRGLSEGWIDAGTRRVAYFTHLPPGEYAFEVMATNGVGVHSPGPAILGLAVLPPFWMTWWFRSVIVLAFLSIGPAVYVRRVTQLKRWHAQQQEFSLRLISSQEAERKRIAAELHDSLGQNIIIIRNRALLGKQAGGDAAAVGEQLDEIAKTAAATLDEMRKIAHNLRPANLERFGLTDTIAHTVDDVGSASGIAMTHALEKIDGVMPPGAEIHMFRIIQEVLNNIVKHSHAGNASVEARKSGRKVVVTIRDDGVGFDPHSPATHTRMGGLGMEDLAQRARLIGALLDIRSGAGSGTEITITLPFDPDAS